MQWLISDCLCSGAAQASSIDVASMDVLLLRRRTSMLATSVLQYTARTVLCEQCIRACYVCATSGVAQTQVV